MLHFCLDPSGSPQTTTAIDIKQREISLTVGNIEKKHENGIIMYYEISYQSLDWCDIPTVIYTNKNAADSTFSSFILQSSSSISSTHKHIPNTQTSNSTLYWPWFFPRNTTKDSSLQNQNTIVNSTFFKNSNTSRIKLFLQDINNSLMNSSLKQGNVTRFGIPIPQLQQAPIEASDWGKDNAGSVGNLLRIHHGVIVIVVVHHQVLQNNTALR